MSKNEKSALPKSNDFRSYLADGFGIVRAASNNIDFYDIIFMKGETTPIIAHDFREDPNGRMTMEKRVDVNHVCTVKLTRSQLVTMRDMIDVELKKNPAE
ncbi:hypothetical protein M2263_001804 [Providencia alcalifaciens]|nr:hypothetical protein [Providencia alcalifaciens]